MVGVIIHPLSAHTEVLPARPVLVLVITGARGTSIQHDERRMHQTNYCIDLINDVH